MVGTRVLGSVTGLKIKMGVEIKKKKKKKVEMKKRNLVKQIEE